MKPKSVYLLAASVSAASCFALTPHQAAQATHTIFTVNHTGDAVDANPGDGVCETGPGNSICTLRAAIQEANAHAGRDMIDLPAGTYRLEIQGRGEEEAATGDLNISRHLIIIGRGPTTPIIDALRIDRVFSVGALVPTDPVPFVEMINVVIRNGDPGPVASGGGIGNAGVVQLFDVTISDSQTRFGGGIANTGKMFLGRVSITGNTALVGGGIHNTGTVFLVDATVTGNTGTATAGGIFNGLAGMMGMDNVTVSKNRAVGDGGGISSQGRLFLMNGSISSNESRTGEGGGIIVSPLTSEATIMNTTVSHNQASLGGGIQNRGTTRLTNVTTSGNTAASGGGIVNLQGMVELTNVTVTDNGSATGAGGIHNQAVTRLKNTIVANSIQGANCVDSTPLGQGLTSLGHNLDSENTCGFSAPGDLIKTDPQLGPLQNNGGPTQTHALRPTSPALDAGDNTGCPATDQRGSGFPRPVDGNRDGVATCDIGAFELELE